MLTLMSGRQLLIKNWDKNFNFREKSINHRIESKEEGKDQELIQSSTTPDPGHHMGKRQKHKKTSHT